MMKLLWFFFSSLDSKLTLFSSTTTQLLDLSEQTHLLSTKELETSIPSSLAFVKLFNKLAILFGVQNNKTCFKLKKCVRFLIFFFFKDFY